MFSPVLVEGIIGRTDRTEKEPAMSNATKPLTMIALKQLFDDQNASIDQRFGTLYQMFMTQEAELTSLRAAVAGLALAPLTTAPARSSNRTVVTAQEAAPKEPVDPAKARTLLEVAYEEALMGCGGKHGDRISSLFGGSTGQKPDGWMSKKWAGDTMPKSEMNAWCNQAAAKVRAAGFETDKKVDGPALLTIISEAYATVAPAQEEADDAAAGEAVDSSSEAVA
jgi:hypothetical protein